VGICDWETWPKEAVKRKRKRHLRVVLPRRNLFLWQWLEFTGILEWAVMSWLDKRCNGDL